MPSITLIISLAFVGGTPYEEDIAAKISLRAGAAAVDVSPRKLPVRVNGGFLEANADKVVDPLCSRAMVLDDGSTRLAIVVVDSCMMPRELLDKAKKLARQACGIADDRILISATHTHSAPAAMGALGCRPDDGYVATLPKTIADSIARATGRLEPARLGWAAVDDAENTHCRRWIRKPDKPVVDPFGQPSARAHMHPGYQNPDAIGPAGPVDPELSVLSVQSLEGRPIAVLANYSMHYFGATAVSADYFGRWSEKFAAFIGMKTGDPFVAMMSQGTSGDQHWMDYTAPQRKITLDEYAAAVARSAERAYRKVDYLDQVTLAMAETTLRLRRRTPDEARLAWARKLVSEMGDRPPKTLPEVYAREAIYLHEEPERELKLQAIRIGALGIAAIPNEVFALSGLKIKALSPLPSTFTIELANGAEGYIPPREQHELGGYTTWPARTAALEVVAEEKIVGAAVRLLETVSGKPARSPEIPATPYSRAMLAAHPFAYWRLEEMAGDTPQLASGPGSAARLTPGFALYLEGPDTLGGTPARPLSRAVHLAGGTFKTPLEGLGAQNTACLLFWSGRSRTDPAWTSSLVRMEGEPDVGLASGKLFVGEPQAPGAPGDASPDPFHRQWHHLVVVHGQGKVTVYLDGVSAAEKPNDGKDLPARFLTIGAPAAGRPEADSFTGKIDEVAVFDRALTADEVAGLARASRGQ